MRDCGDCGAKPGELHQGGCDVERCPLCGGQMISDNCVYELSGIQVGDMEETHPEIYMSGPTEELYKRYDEEIAKYGGRLPWEGDFPGSKAAADLGLFCYWDDRGKWVACDANHPEARPDLNRLHTSAYWDKEKRVWKKQRTG